jgi:hypothetical protein
MQALLRRSRRSRIHDHENAERQPALMGCARHRRQSEDDFDERELPARLGRLLVSATIAASALGFCDNSTHAAHLLFNGGFEMPTVLAPDKWEIFPGTTGVLVPGWTVEWRDSLQGCGPNAVEPQLELQRGLFTPAEGQQYAELSSDCDGSDTPSAQERAAVRISQDIPTVPGYWYTILLAHSPRPGVIDNR